MDMQMMNQALAAEYFDHKDGHLYWKKVMHPNKQCLVGQEAGSIHSTGYRHVTWQGKVHKVHRLIFLLEHGYVPEEIDHINGNRADNRIENLRSVTRSQNQYNKRQQRNASGYRGVTWHKKTGKWLVRVGLNNKNKSLGYYDDLELAALVAEEGRSLHYGQFAYCAQGAT
jgi:hypothetical protein